MISTTDEKSKFAKRTKSGLYWNTTLKIFQQIVRFGISIILARILDPVDFGIMAIGNMVIHYTNSLSDFGFNNAIVQKDNIEAKHINSVFTFNLFVSIFLFFVTLSAAPFISSFFNSPECKLVIMYMSSLFLITTFRDVYESILRRSIRFKYISVARFIEGIIQSAVAITLAMHGFRYWSLVWSSIISYIVGGIILYVKIEIKPKIQYDHNSMKSIYSFGLWNFIRAQLYFFNQYITQVIIGKLFGTAPLGFFEKSYQLAATPRDAIASQVNSVMFSSFSRIQNDPKQIKEWFLRVILIESAMLIPILAGIIAIADHLIIILIGEKWRLSIIPLQILSLGIIFQMFNGLVTSLNVGIGLYKKHTHRTLISSLIFVILCFLLKKWGVAGISWAYTLNMLLMSILSFDLASKQIDLTTKKLFLTILPYIIANLSMIVSIRYLSHIKFHDYSIINLVILSSSGAIFYLLSIFTFNSIKGHGILYPLKSGKGTINAK